MKTKLLVLVLVLQCAWIFGTAITQEHSRRTGDVILLETQPVDPRDLLRGDYVTLSYKISDVPFDRFTSAIGKVLPSGVTVYVTVVPASNGFHEIMKASLQPFTPDPGQVLLIGKSHPGWMQNAIRVEYGLEKFYVPEGKGNPAGKLIVQAAVPKSGRATIKEVLIDGVPYLQAMKKPAQPRP